MLYTEYFLLWFLAIACLLFITLTRTKKDNTCLKHRLKYSQVQKSKMLDMLGLEGGWICSQS